MAHYTSFVSAEAFDLQLSINFLAMIIIGGLGSVMGFGLMGTVFILFLPEFMQSIVRSVQSLGFGQGAATEGLAYLKKWPSAWRRLF